MPVYYFQQPHINGSITIGLEHFSDMVEEIRPLHELHFEETEVLYLDAPFQPNYEQYMGLEKEGSFVCFTVRIGWQIVAYIQYYLFDDLHARQAKNAREDAFYVHPSVRSNGVGGQLLDYAENALRQLGCQYVGMTTKAPLGGADIGPYLERREYRPVAVYYQKKLES
jgi:GNAT superfamily N-acetyltransferase